jgi:hypothetical protein
MVLLKKERKMEWNEINLELLYYTFDVHNLLALDVDNANEEGEANNEMWSDLEESFENTLKEYVQNVLGEHARYFYKAFRSKAEALDWIAESTNCYLNSIDEDRMIDFISEIRLVTFLSYSKGMTVHRAA